MKRTSWLFIALSLLMLSGIKNCKPTSGSEKDPYLWLEEIEGEKALDWARAQNARSAALIDASPLFEPMYEQLKEIYNDRDKIAYPTLVGDFVYNFWQDEVHERGIWRRMPKEAFIHKGKEWETVLDLDKLSVEEGKKWVFKGADWLKPGHTICLLYLSDGGSDKDYLREFNATSKTFVRDGFYHEESKGGASWMNENTILIARDFGEGTLTTSGYARTIRKWERGSSVKDAPVVFEGDSTDVSEVSFSHYFQGGRFSFIRKARTFYDADYFLLEDGELEQLSVPHDAVFYGMFRHMFLLVLQSDWTVNGETYAEGSLVSLNFLKDGEGKTEVRDIFVPSERSSLVSLSTSKDFITINSMVDVQNKLLNYRYLNGTWTGKPLETPGFASINLEGSDDQSDDYFFSFSNFISPTTLYHSDGSGTETVQSLKATFDTTGLQIGQQFAVSKDGTAIPYFIVHRKNVVYNGENPVVINAYGGFNVSRQPNYSSTIGKGWLEHGGIFVLANIRGGGEYGPAWHQAAMKEKRQNAFDDLYAVSEDLIARKVTSPERLGIYGGSNGGLLVGVAFTQRPELYKAVVCAVPLLDMKRYSKLLAGASWIGEYGDPDIPEEWEYIKKYSPYQNLSRDADYPEIFFITSTKDDRVHPGHARKMVAKMTEMGHQVYYHETIEGGHGAASTNDQAAHMWASIFTFLNLELNTD